MNNEKAVTRGSGEGFGGEAVEAVVTQPEKLDSVETLEEMKLRFAAEREDLFWKQLYEFRDRVRDLDFEARQQLKETDFIPQVRQEDFPDGINEDAVLEYRRTHEGYDYERRKASIGYW
jgi:hypothetical protein